MEREIVLRLAPLTARSFSTSLFTEGIDTDNSVRAVQIKRRQTSDIR